MKKRTIPYRRILLLAAMIALSAALIVVAFVRDIRSLLILSVPLLITSTWALLAIYRDIIKRINTVFEVIEGNDLLRLTDDPAHTDNAMINYLMNRIMESMSKVRHQIKEKEQYIELIMECANIGIIVMQEKGAIVQANSNAVQLFGLRRLSHIDQLRPQSEQLADTLLAIRCNEQKVVKYMTETGEITLSLNCSEMQQGEKRLRVVTIGDVNNMLSQQELESWGKLTRILTHEIMNSLAPVTSISNTLLSKDVDEQTMQKGLQTINSTSQRLLSFVDSFRSVTRIPPPQKSPVYLAELVTQTASLVEWGDIELSTEIVPADTMLYVDRTQMAQVFLNLMKNAQEALLRSEAPRHVNIKSRLNSHEQIIIDVSNNCGPIAEDIVENIFTPFFSTKRNGSGIGLALSRQIVHLHGGTLSLSSNTPDRITFTIVLE